MSKREQRAAALAARRAMSPEDREAAGRAICERLDGLPEVKHARTVLSYMALPDEADLSALHARLRRRGVRLLFPVSLPGGVMEAREPRGWKTGPYGIREPDAALSPLVPPEEIDLILAPCVAFDAQRARLGHGAGFYDRYLAAHAVLRLGLCAARCLADTLPAEPTDQTMDSILTESGFVAFNKI